MGQTSNPTLRWPDATERPRAVQIRNLAEDTHAAIQSIRTELDAPPSAYTPGWTSGPGGANILIMDGSLEGLIYRSGKKREVHITLQRGANTNQGSATGYAFTLPSTDQPLAARWVTGYGLISRNGTEAQTFPVAVWGTGGLNVVLVPPEGGRVSGSPGWTASGWIRFVVFYRVA